MILIFLVHPNNLPNSLLLGYCSTTILYPTLDTPYSILNSTNTILLWYLLSIYYILFYLVNQYYPRYLGILLILYFILTTIVLDIILLLYNLYLTLYLITILSSTPLCRPSYQYILDVPLCSTVLLLGRLGNVLLNIDLLYVLNLCLLDTKDYP